MNCCVVALSLFFPDSLTWSADRSYSVQRQIYNKESGCRKICILCQQTSPKRWFGSMEMTSNCDVTNSAHQKQITTIWPWTKPPPWTFAAYATVSSPMKRVSSVWKDYLTPMGRAYYGMEWNMDWKEKTGMEYGMEWKIWWMEWNKSSIFHTNSILANFDMVLLKSGFSFSWTY